MKTATAKNLFPVLHWIATLVLAPFIDALFTPDTKLLISIDNYLVLLFSAIVTAFPALILYFIIYKIAQKKFNVEWQFKLFLVLIAGLLMLISLELFDKDLRKDYSPAYGIAIWVTSLFLPVKTTSHSKYPRSSEQ